MRIRDRITKLRLIIFGILMLIPMAAFALGIKLLIADTLISWAFVITYLALPLILITLLILIIFFKFEAVR